MNTLYVISSEDSFLVHREILKITSKYPSFESVRYDLKEVSISRVIEDLDTLNFLSEGKIVIAENAYFLTAERPTGVIEQDTSLLDKYLENPNPSNILILVTTKLDERKKQVKLLKEKAKVIQASLDAFSLIQENLDDFSMDDAVKRYLIDKVLGNVERVFQELLKLKLYCFDQKKITKEDIDLLVIPLEDDNIFHLIDAIIAGKREEAFKIYEDLILHNEEPIKILVLLASRFRLYYQVKVLMKKNLNDTEIGKIIGSHPYPVKLARGVVRNYEEKKLLHYLKHLAQIDLDVKRGNTYQNIALETFILTVGAD